jgi:hypothetical protein
MALLKRKLHYFDLECLLIDFKDNLLSIVNIPSNRLEDHFDFPYLVMKFVTLVIEEDPSYREARLYDELYLLCNYHENFGLINSVVDHFRMDLLKLREKAVYLDGNDIISRIRCFSRYCELVIGIDYDIKSNCPLA